MASEELRDTEAEAVDDRLDELERRALELTEESRQKTLEAHGALGELAQALRQAREQMRQRGFPVANELEPR